MSIEISTPKYYYNKKFLLFYKCDTSQEVRPYNSWVKLLVFYINICCFINKLGVGLSDHNQILHTYCSRDVISISLLGGVAGRIVWRILKDRPRLPICG